MSKRQILDSGVQKLLPLRKSNRGRPPTILSIDTDTRTEQWIFPVAPRDLNDEQKKLLTACMVEQMVGVVFTTHYYEWDGQLYHQQKGCPMGMRPSGPCSGLLVEEVADEVEEIQQKTEIISKL